MMSPVASTGILRVPVADSVDGTDCTVQPLSGSDSKARAPNDHGDEGLHATGTNISQLPRAAGKEKKRAQNESSHRSLSCSCENAPLSIIASALTDSRHDKPSVSSQR